MSWTATRYPGIQVRHRKACPAPEGRCRCTPSYRARDGRRPWSLAFPTLDAARSWQTDARNARTPEAIAARTGDTFETLALRFIDGARAGHIASRSREPFAPRTLTIYEANLRRHVFPTYGPREAASLTVLDWQLLVDDLARHALSHNTLQTILNGVRAVYRWACAPSRRLLAVNETRGVEMPAKDEKRRDRIAPPDEARALLAALTQPCDVLDFALALYAGLRNMERWPLDWTDVDLERRILHVRKSKTKAGVRTLPIIGRLRPVLMREWMRQGQPSSGAVLRYPHGGQGVNAYDKQAARVAKEWEAAHLTRITPHEARHTFASYLIASGLNAKAVTVLMGHKSVQTTFDQYGKLFPGHEDEAGTLLDALLGVPEPDREELASV